MPVLPSLPNPVRVPSSRFRASRTAALGFAGLTLLAVAARGQSPAPSCGPGVREIFDFHVGDVFQYRTVGTVPYPGGSGFFNETIRKYKVVSRNESGFIRTYDLSSLEFNATLRNGVLQSRTYSDHAETRAYFDTAGSPFNGCAGAIVPMTSSDQSYVSNGNPVIVTRVEELRGDTSAFPLAKPGLRMKAYGRVQGMRQDTVIAPIPDAGPVETYAEGLGLVSADYGYTIGGAHTRTLLIGYVKDGDTVGVVSPDSSFWHPSALNPPTARRSGARGLPGAEAGPAYDAAGRFVQGTEARASAAAMPRFRK